MHKEDGKGKLTLSITEHNGTVQCSIADNGVGREKAALYKSKSAEKEKSLGLKITKARLDLLNGDMGNATSFSIKDLVDSQGNVTGTIVNLAMNCNPPAKSKQDVESNHY
jgi:LytS/YehU family sensor histidine kinase